MAEASPLPRLKEQLKAFNSSNQGLQVILEENSRPPALLILALKGHADNTNAGALLALLEEVITDNPAIKTMILHLGGVNYISSTGLGTLSHLLIKTQEEGIRLRLCSIPEKVLSIFHLLGFTRFFDIYPGPEEAIAAEETD